MTFKTLETETQTIDSELSISKFLIEKDTKYRVLLEFSQPSDHNKSWDYDTLKSAESKYYSIELDEFRCD